RRRAVGAAKVTMSVSVTVREGVGGAARDPFRDPFDTEISTKYLAVGEPSIASSERDWRVLHSRLVFRLLPKLDVVGSSPIARSWEDDRRDPHWDPGDFFMFGTAIDAA